MGRTGVAIGCWCCPISSWCWGGFSWVGETWSGFVSSAYGRMEAALESYPHPMPAVFLVWGSVCRSLCWFWEGLWGFVLCCACEAPIACPGSAHLIHPHAKPAWPHGCALPERDLGSNGSSWAGGGGGRGLIHSPGTWGRCRHCTHPELVTVSHTQPTERHKSLPGCWLTQPNGL